MFGGLNAFGLDLGIAVIVVGAALGLGLVGCAALNGTARQPEVFDKLRTTMLIVGALIEGLALVGMIIILMLAFISGAGGESGGPGKASPAPAATAAPTPPAPVVGANSPGS